ncbi:hypothetical protein [Oceanicaulis sp. HTCC2633]|uniref:hypothetical protein n=1 Tax=Oceanicaulis sp. HTCC2633 TaxID=314254 RepID=UPI0019D6E7EE|nr:hypothetical protein [Oceanicaulis sp. HTCC2633]
MPVFRLSRPTTASYRAAWAQARRAVPGRDEGESEDEYIERLRETLAAYGADMPEGRLDLQDRLEGALEAIALTAHAAALLIDWSGFVDEETQEALEPTLPAIRAAMRDPYVAARFESWASSVVGPMVQEGNG